MPHISKNTLSKKTEQELIHSLQTVLIKIKESAEMESFLLSLMSKTERLMLAKRLAVVILLNENVATSRISSILHVTRETVYRIELLNETKGHGYEIALKKLEEDKLFQDFKKVLISLARYTVRASGGRI